MGFNSTLNAKPREVSSSNYANRLRAQGLLPIIFYGHDLTETKSLSLEYAQFKSAFLNTEGNRFLYNLAIEGQSPAPVLLKDYQVDPISRKVIHADFVKIDPAKPVTVKVPVVLKGRAQGVEKGGQIQQSEREVTVTALPSAIPDQLIVDITPLGLGQTMHLSEIKLPDGLSLAKTVDLPVAVVTLPKGMKAEAEAEAGAGAGDKKAADKKANDKKK
ncbi:MAG: 50S ribosomal protein L25 [Deltaproteobacteria bacterium]|jgi:large subunit ribosomal protein L25|nr:50S ribosomal protein L25 [Deltaproteobacteria bacterium]